MRTTIITAAVLAVGATFAHSANHSQLPQPVKARQGIMQNYAFSLGTLGDMAKGEREYDAELAQAAADRLVALSDLTQAGYWPEGTSSEELEGSRALPAVWDGMDDFISQFDDLHIAATSMAEVAGSGQEALGPQMKALGDACGDCHEDYRMSDD